MKSKRAAESAIKTINQTVHDGATLYAHMEQCEPVYEPALSGSEMMFVDSMMWSSPHLPYMTSTIAEITRLCEGVEGLEEGQEKGEDDEETGEEEGEEEGEEAGEEEGEEEGDEDDDEEMAALCDRLMAIKG
eukprot:4710831-Prymnesium_polylepis.1